MKTLLRPVAMLSLLSIFLIAAPSQILAQIQKPELPKTPPNTTLKVQSQSGNCPQTASLWTSFRYYEGGGQHTVILDTSRISGAAKLVSSGKKVVQFRAPLKKAYATCVGEARHEELPYLVRFRGGNVILRVALPADTPANPSQVDLASIVATRPFVLWSIAD